MRSFHLSSLCILTLGLLSAVCNAQGGGPPIQPGKPGFMIAGLNGNSAGPVCSGFSCTAAKMNTTKGDKLTFTIRSPLGAPYLVLIGSSPLPNCITWPGIGNLWAGPLIPFAAGTCNQNDLIRCWGGLGSFGLTVPSGVNPGASVVFQAVVENVTMAGAKTPVFSTPVQVTVQ